MVLPISNDLFISDLPFIVYSDVVDKRNFVSCNSDKQALNSGFDSGASPGVYDFNGGDFQHYRKFLDNSPDNILINLRNGVYSREEVSKYKEYLKSKLENDLSISEAKSSNARLIKQYQRQLDIVDNFLGLKSLTEYDAEHLFDNSPK
ncbi:hypothetical protein [Capybara microvirus Cap3_SP_316]|nr:hypothetical protein [Capybara microvirus Cap3_SP_316]